MQLATKYQASNASSLPPIFFVCPAAAFLCVFQVKLNTDESPSVATEYGIRSIPTVMIFKGGQKLDTVIGRAPLAAATHQSRHAVVPWLLHPTHQITR
jgi:hypothetical protein